MDRGPDRAGDTEHQTDDGELRLDIAERRLEGDHHRDSEQSSDGERGPADPLRPAFALLDDNRDGDGEDEAGQADENRASAGDTLEGPGHVPPLVAAPWSQLALVGGVLLIVVYIGRLTVLNPESNVIRLAALASGLVVVPAVYVLFA